MNRILYLIIICLFGHNLIGQSPYAEIDDYVRSNKFTTKNIESLTHELTDRYDTDKEKVRAIYIWITDNIAYDFKKIKNKGSNKAKKAKSKNKFTYSSEAEYHQKVRERKRAVAKSVIKNKKGICQDYATLFTEMCTIIGVESRIISGHGKNNRNTIGKVPKATGHAWNSVRVDSTWYLLDATWASGGSQGGNFKYKKRFKEGFFLVDPENFIKNHLPKEEKYQYLDTPISALEFSQIPFIGFGYYKYKVTDYSPKNVFIKPASELFFTIKMTRDVDPENIGVFVNKTKIPAKVIKDEEEYKIVIKSFKKKSGKLSIIIREGTKQSSEVMVYKLKS